MAPQRRPDADVESNVSLYLTRIYGGRERRRETTSPVAQHHQTQQKSPFTRDSTIRIRNSV